MAVRNILTYPDPLLQRVAKPVDTFDAGVQALVADMVETMRVAPGIGLAAPQVGVSLRVIVIEISDESGQPVPVYAICNPEITRREGEARIEEGCLSCPGLYLEVDRAAKVAVTGKNPDGSPLALEADGLLAICLQHEIDHLDGRLLTHYLSPIKRDLYRKELERGKFAAEESPAGAL